MTEYINNGGYGEPIPIYQFHYTPYEFKCPREFWSNESIFLEKLVNEISSMERAEMDYNRNHHDNRDWATAILLPSRHTDWRSPEFGPLSVFRFSVSVRLNNSLYADAQAAGFESDRDIINYYNNKKQE